MSTLRVDNIESTDGLFTIGTKELANTSLALSLSELRAYTGTASRVYVHNVVDGQDAGGYFDLNSGVVSPVDNTGTRIVDGNGKAWDRDFHGPINAKWFGLRGDGVTDESVAFNKAVAAAQDSHALFFPDGKYVVNSPVTMTHRTVLLGTGEATLIGQFTYDEAAFPISADAPGNNTTSSPWLTIRGINFQSSSVTAYALTVKAQAGSSFIDCMEMRDCKFYGIYGFLGKNLISVTIENCWFYSVYIGIRAEGCVNWNVNGCWFRNARQAGLYITYNADAPARKGGENVRVANCEFAVCTKGIYAFRHVWLNVDNCLFDYNILPIELHGSYYAKVSNSYLGASQQGSLAGGAGYVAPATVGCAFYAHGATADSLGSASYCGITMVNCELVNYLSGTTFPLAYVEGYISPSENQLAERVVFVGNKFIATQTWAGTTMLSISYASESMVTGNSFVSPNLSSTLTSTYTAANTPMHNGIGNLNSKCLQSSTTVVQPYEYQTSIGIRGTSASGVWLQSSGGANVIGVNSSNQPAFANVTETTTATPGAAATPTGYTGYITVNINGTNRKIGFYGT